MLQTHNAWAMSRAAPRHVTVYGGDHSPWVQAVLLGLHEKRIPHTVLTAPPASVFANSGILMPAASIDGRAWMLGSGEILAELGFSKVSPEDTRAVFRALYGAPQRVDSGPRFWSRWSRVRDGRETLVGRLWNHFLRAFSVLYFYLTLKSVARQLKLATPDGPRQFLPWERRLQENGGPFLGGDQPDTLDLQLFGAVQSLCSIPIPPVAILQSDPALPRLREWIGAMHRRFADYRHLYSGGAFEPFLPPTEPAPVLERSAFWAGSLFMLIAFPITVPLWAYYMLRVRRTGMIGIPGAKRS